MNNDIFNEIVWWIPFKKLRNSVRILLSEHFKYIVNASLNTENIVGKLNNMSLNNEYHINFEFNRYDKDYGTIFDIGMNNGSDTEFYLKKGFKVVAVEANPSLVNDAYKKFDKYILSGKLVIYSNGITDEKDAGKILNFYINPNDVWSSFDEKIGSIKPDWFDSKEEVKVIQVSMISMNDLFKKHGIPYYIKIDVEGYDSRLLADIKNLTDNRPKYISVEGPGNLNNLVSLGAKYFKIVNQKYNPEITRLPIPPKEGIFCNHTFIEGSSGLFGDEIEGDWLSYEEISSIIKNTKKYPIDYAWYDIHAKFF